MTDLARLADRAARDHLAVVGTLGTHDEDGFAQGQTLALLGPSEPDFWPHVTAAPEFLDGQPDPLDRWSARVISQMADELGGTALFPFGTPKRPFLQWAMRSGQIWQSPVGLLVHGRSGLWVSFRGALLLPERLSLPEPEQSPCLTCADQPCLAACPVDALTGTGYDIAACHSYLDTTKGHQSCLTQGCAVRAACPVSAQWNRIPAQSAFHMRSFHP